MWPVADGIWADGRICKIRKKQNIIDKIHNYQFAFHEKFIHFKKLKGTQIISSTEKSDNQTFQLSIFIFFF